MTTKTFRKKLIKLIEDNGEFCIDLIDMHELREHAIRFGFDDVIYVVGENEKEVFVLNITKIK